MSRFFSKQTADAPAPTADPIRSPQDTLVAARMSSLQELVDQVEATIKATADLIGSDTDLGREYRAYVVQPWRGQCMAAHERFRTEVVGNLPSLREATDLIRRGDAAIAVSKYGVLLAELRDLEASLAAIKRDRPEGIARVSLHQTAGLARRPSNQAEEILSLLLAGQAERAAMGEVDVEDVVSRLGIENVDPAAFTIHLGTSVVYAWNHPSVATEVSA